MTTHQRNPYTGTKRSLVIGIDVGTTLSGVSYAFLEPGKVSRFSTVVWFSGQREERNNPKVPSVVCYDQDGNVIAAGSETDPEINPTLSEIDGIRRAEWFKLRLRPPHLAADKRSQLEKILSPPEPIEEIDDDFGDDEYENKELLELEGIGGKVVEPEPLKRKKIPRPVTDDFKTAVQVFADFLQYLFKSAKEYIIETERCIDTTFLWSSIERNTYFVLTHPSGWEGKQQSQMRDAAVAAGLVDNSTAADRIIFVTEGEANLHFCLEMNPELRKESGGLLVVDCGGGTIDLSAYSQTEKGGFKEIVSPDCLLQGSIFVTSRARNYFKGKFKDSPFGTDDDIEAMARVFDKPEGAKCMFRNPVMPCYVKFGGLRDNDRKFGIANGILKIEGAQVAKFFEPAVQDIIDGITNQFRSIKDGVSVKVVLLVGGFGRSDYLYERLHDHFKNSGIVVLRPDNALLNKAVADGAVAWYLATQNDADSISNEKSSDNGSHFATAGVAAENILDGSYLEILNRVQDQSFLKTFLGLLVGRFSITWRDGLSNDDAMLMDISKDELRERLHEMHSILRFEPVIEVHHRSFLDFLQDSPRSGQYHVNRSAGTRRYLELITKLLIKHARLANHGNDHFAPEFGKLIKRNPQAIELDVEDWEQTLRPLLNALEKLLVPSNIDSLIDGYCQQCQIFQITHDTLTHFKSLRRKEDPVVEKCLKSLEEIILCGNHRHQNFETNFRPAVFGSAAIFGILMAILARY